MQDEPRIELLAFTDPVCTWCWGSEPVLRKLQVYYGNALSIRYVMGGLVKDIRAFYDQANDIGGDPEQSNAQIARHWLEASARHGMPVRIEGFRLFSADTTSTYPQNIAVKAAELTDSTLAPRYLRRIREASAAEGRETGRKEVLVELANDVGIDVSTFVGHVKDGSAEQAFRDDLAITQRYGVRGFPTFLFRHAGKELMLRSYQTFRAMQAVIETLSGGTVQARAPESGPEGVFAFLRRFGRAAPVEVATVFDLSAEESDRILTLLANERRVHRTVAGNGVFWEPEAPAGACAIDDGVCVPDR